MKIPIYYNYRNLLARKLTTGLTVLGIGLVVFVFSGVLMLAYGIKKTLVATGSEDNATVIRKASLTEMMSYITRDQVSIIESQPEIARGPDGKPLVAGELYVLISLNKIKNGDAANVVLRGVGPASMLVHSGVKLIEGRMFTEGLPELIVGKSTAQGFQGAQLGGSIRFAKQNWRVVGIFEAGKSAFESEVWGDVNQMLAAFNRPVVSSMTLKLADPSKFTALKERLEKDPRLSVDVKREKEYYADQSYAMTSFIKILGVVISVIFSFGAVIGAMITMYANIANRAKEIGTLRVLGFKRRNILSSFLVESILLSLAGGVVGVVFASFLSMKTISTTNWDTFSELAFGFAVTPEIVAYSLIFAVVMGVVGGFLPAVRAARMNILTALRAE
ncbi:MAG: ABC transporter membrane protein [candidate division Zixibacteria bacterium RBG-1]|nr:MAG: ABC transporter membrane protein [candidate division Zixibacteria bacterium RBG-1]OGC86584.1 MAG: multidrug ABC transporter permease [candidate division Zixibacteria bacterium RBG_19FT_COMBO_42_43]